MAAKTLDFVQIGEGGEGEVVWTKSKRAAAFFLTSSLIDMFMLIVILRCSCMSGPVGCSLSGAHLGPREPQPPEQHIQQHNKQSSRQVAS